jgi:hypothetical protein
VFFPGARVASESLEDRYQCNTLPKDSDYAELEYEGVLYPDSRNDHDTSRPDDDSAGDV